MDIAKKIAEELGIKTEQVNAVIKLIEEGNTIPFIARYRKEQHGALNDEVLRNLDERLRYLNNLEERKTQVIGLIEEQGKLTDELRQAIEAAEALVTVEDLYRPYKQKRRTRATIAKEAGLSGLATIISLQQTDKPLEEEALNYLNEEKGITDAQSAIKGAMDIIAEEISDNAEYRKYIRNITFDKGNVVSEAKDKEAQSVYEIYYSFSEPVKKITGYRILAINRGEAEKVLTVKIEAPVDEILDYLCRKVIIRDNKYTTEVLKETVADSYTRLIAPSIENDIRAELTENAEDGAIKVFGKNLTQLLMQPPITGKRVLGWDPAFRTGCKLAVVDETGKVLYTTVVYPTEPQNKVAETKQIVADLVKKYGISLISVGNGTASRESEMIISDMIKELHLPVSYVIVNEAGASVYSASKLATEEFPEFDVGQRSAASIARRLQDPLAELVKIEPKAIGVGQYQHDMNKKKLEEALSAVVEDCVNRVGVDLNTASAPLLSYVSGINGTIAKNIVNYREENGKFKNRKELLKVSKLGPKAFLQCAGFMRIMDGDNPLDSSSVHPESYKAAEELLSALGYDLSALRGGIKGITVEIKKHPDLTAKVDVGELTLKDIISELEKPGRDPRADLPAPILRTDVLDMKDLKEGMIMKGTVRNVIDFGAFVDIGVHQDGLVHISELSDKKFVKHPLEVVSVGDIVDVKVIGVDIPKKRISLSIKQAKG